MSLPPWDGSPASDPYRTVGPSVPESPESPADASGPWVTRRDLGVGALLVVGLAVAGVLLGLVWPAITPRAHGFVYLNHTVVPLETESLVAADGRFLLLTGAVALVAGLTMWLDRASRGPAVAVALAAGGLLGAALTDLVGRVTGGGKTSGALGDGLTLPVTLHARGLLVAEPAVALFAYVICVLFAKRDDLARPVEPDPQAVLVPAPYGR